MRKLLVGLALASLPLAAGVAVAHPEDFDGEYQRAPTIPELAKDAVYKLISQSKLAPSWSSATAVRNFERTRGGATQLVVAFRNDAIRDPAKRTLYVVMTAGGQFISANHRLN